MNLPKFYETFIPILKALENGEMLYYKDLQKKVRDEYYLNLSKELLSKKTTTGANVLLNRIHWGTVYLKQGKFIERPKTAMVQITKKGKDALKNEKLTWQDLKNDLDFLAHRKVKKTEKEVKSEEVEIENASPQDSIDSGFFEIELQIKNDLLEKLKNIDPYFFETVIGKLLNKMGYGDFVGTPKSNDDGIDGIINEDKLGIENIYIQAKRWTKNPVRKNEISHFIGAMSGGAKKGIFVTTSSFDSPAIKKAKEGDYKIILIDGNKLVDLMYQYGVGVQVRNIYELKQVDEDFFEEN